MSEAVAKLLKDDMWTLAEVDTDLGIAFIRFREPVLGRGQVGDYVHRLSVTWIYADQNSGAHPSDEQDGKLAHRRPSPEQSAPALYHSTQDSFLS